MQAVKNLLFRLVIPSILFSTIIYLPKLVFHGGDVSLGQYFFDVFGGISYWFTSALAVAQLLLLTVRFGTRQAGIWIYVAISLLFFIMGWTLNSQRSENVASEFFPWFYQTGLEYTLIMVLGGFYQRYEDYANRLCRRYGIVPVFFYLTILVYASFNDGHLGMLGLGGGFNAMGLVAVLCGVILITALCKWLNPFGWLTWIGRNSIVFYFFSGVYPALTGTVCAWLYPDKVYLMVLPVTILSVCMGAVTTYVVMRFAPFLVDLRKLRR